MRVSQIFLTLLIAVVPNIGQAWWSQEDLDCLVKNVYYESATESRQGQIAVAHVTLNRVKSKIFPNTICEVVYQPHQFSWTKLRKLQTINDSLLEKVTSVAVGVLEGKYKDPTQGAKFFHNFSVNPNWAYVRKQTVVIGNHVFYK
jgi:N-acetylmuramoyl-L-alanine amidase